MLNLFDLLGARYGVLPCEIRRLSWDDLLFSLKCLRTRSKRFNETVKRYKKAGLQASLSIADLTDMI
jgi:hypothetical protein